MVTVTAAVPETPSAVAVMVVVPAACAVKTPVASMVPTVSSLLAQATPTPVMGLSSWSRTAAWNARDSPISRVTLAGLTSMVVTTGSIGSTDASGS